MHVEPAQLCSAEPLPEVMQAAQAVAGGKPLGRCLIYAPDAIGTQLLFRFPKEIAVARRFAPLQVELDSVLPTVTPVCFASMFTGAPPALHGIQTYARPRLICDTLFDALARSGKRVAIVAVRNSSIDIIFRGRAIDYFTEDYDPQVTQRTLALLQQDQHDFILAYHQEYDDLLHKSTPFSDEALAAVRRHLASFAELAAAADQYWAGHSRMVACCPDHGAHIDPVTGRGTHGSALPADMQVSHFLGIAAPN